MRLFSLLFYIVFRNENSFKINIAPYGGNFYYWTYWDKIWNLEIYVSEKLPLRNYGMYFRFSRNNGVTV